MKKLLPCLLILNFCIADGQSISWYEGSVVLATGKVLTGKISIDAFHDLLLLEDAGKRTVFPAHKVRSLYFYDDGDNINRRFVSVLEKDVITRSYHFFEVVVQGEIKVLRRQRVRGRQPADDTGFSYHFQYKDEILGLRNFMRKVYPALRSPFNDQLRDFIRRHDLDANTYANAIRIIEYYDRLIRLDQTLAKQ